MVSSVLRSVVCWTQLLQACQSNSAHLSPTLHSGTSQWQLEIDHDGIFTPQKLAKNYKSACHPKSLLLTIYPHPLVWRPPESIRDTSQISSTLCKHSWNKYLFIILKQIKISYFNGNLFQIFPLIFSFKRMHP